MITIESYHFSTDTCMLYSRMSGLLEAQADSIELATRLGYSDLLIDQIAAATDARLAITELQAAGTLFLENPAQLAVKETDVFRFRPGLCLPSAASVAINHSIGQRVIGDDHDTFTVGDYFRFLLPHHGKYVSTDIPRGWLVVDEGGNMYHHAIIAFSQALGIQAHSISGVTNLNQYRELLENGGGVAVSVSNRFVIEQTLSGYPGTVDLSSDRPKIRVTDSHGDVSYQPFPDGRHVVTLLGFDQDSAVIADSFNLPQTRTHGLVATLPVETANRYLHYHDQATPRAIAFLPHGVHLPDTITPARAVIPEAVAQDLQTQVAERLQSFTSSSH